MSGTDLADRLLASINRFGRLAIAVSGGIDSMTLAFVAHRYASCPVTMVHAISPAVPEDATQRVKKYAVKEGWDLVLVDAGEFADRSYLANPIDRCYFCKSNLYNRIAQVTNYVIASGTNLDDLDDFRPGLRAAAEREVVHPYVDASIGKAQVYQLAREYRLNDISSLPAQPCLASRIETGIPIDANDLAFVYRVERAVSAVLPQRASVRCRITRQGAMIEIDVFGTAADDRIAEVAGELCAKAGRTFAGIRPYRRGAAFVRTP